MRPLVILLRRLLGAALNEIGGHYGAIRRYVALDRASAFHPTAGAALQ